MARVDTLPNFLTDVADAIRAKTGSSSTIQASTFDTEIRNIPSGGGETPKSGKELNDMIVEMQNVLDDYIMSYPSTYEADTTDAITLHTPDMACPYYGIQKRSNGKYRVFWTKWPCLCITSDSIYRMDWGYTASRDQTSDYTSVKAVIFKVIPGHATRTESTPQFYYSAEKTTTSALITAMENGTLTYTSYNGSGLGFAPDTPLVIPYSNAAYLDCRTEDDVLLPSKRISSNETISL